MAVRENIKPAKILRSFLLPESLADWIKEYAKQNGITVTQIVVDQLMEFKKKVETYVEQV